jgi:hypothetical protein
MKPQSIAENKHYDNMLLSNTNKISKVVATILLAAIVSVFSYSELWQNCFDNPTSNDYCEIVKSAQASKNLTKDLFKPQVDKSLCFHCIDEIDQRTKAFTIFVSEQFHTPQKTTEVYLFNRTFLI